MLPDKSAKCHLTGFTKSCLRLVSSGACKRWKALPVNDPATGKDDLVYDCLDNHAHVLRWCTLRAIDQAAASTDKVANEVKKSRDENATMAAIAIQRSTDTIRRALGPVETALMIEDQDAHRNS